jgi:hypothetical protein
VTLLEAIRNEERKLAMEVNKVQRELNGIRAAARSLGGSARKIAKNKYLNMQLRVSLRPLWFQRAIDLSEVAAIPAWEDRKRLSRSMWLPLSRCRSGNPTIRPLKPSILDKQSRIASKR